MEKEEPERKLILGHTSSENLGENGMWRQKRDLKENGQLYQMP